MVHLLHRLHGVDAPAVLCVTCSVIGVQRVQVATVTHITVVSQLTQNTQQTLCHHSFIHSLDKQLTTSARPRTLGLCALCRVPVYSQLSLGPAAVAL